MRLYHHPMFSGFRMEPALLGGLERTRGYECPGLQAGV
jgi:hypothetical protein